MNTHTEEVFVGDTCGPDEYVAFFEATEGKPEEETPPGGYLYISDRKDQKIIRHLEIYDQLGLDIHEDDVQIFWSADGSKCGIAIWGRMRGVINLINGREVRFLLKDRHSDAITDREWLSGFENYLDQNHFIRARQRYWKEIVRQYENIKPRPEEGAAIETNFVHYKKGPDSLFAVFEDDNATGYLYLYDLYDSQAGSVARHLHLYDRSPKLTVASRDVEVVWSEDGAKCGAIIWDKLRGIIDRAKDRPGRVWMESKDSPGINDQEWLTGFEYLFPS
jgi:hypothetical protein